MRNLPLPTVLIALIACSAAAQSTREVINQRANDCLINNASDAYESEICNAFRDGVIYHRDLPAQDRPQIIDRPITFIPNRGTNYFAQFRDLKDIEQTLEKPGRQFLEVIPNAQGQGWLARPLNPKNTTGGLQQLVIPKPPALEYQVK